MRNKAITVLPCILDALMISISIYMSLIIRFLGRIPEVFWENFTDLIGPVIMLHLIIYYIFGLYMQKQVLLVPKNVVRCIIPTMLGMISACLLSVLYAPLPRSSFLIASLILMLYVVISRCIIHIGYRLSKQENANLIVNDNSFTISGCITEGLLSGIINSVSNSARFLRKHKEVTLVVVLSFIMRYFIAGRIPYWYDELLSVVVRGIDLGRPISVLQFHHQNNSSTPFYEFILSSWVQLFGHSEVSTRSLSAVLVGLATLLVYMLVLKYFSRRVAFASAIFFNYSYMAMYYSLEARYYSLILFLGMLSSYLLLTYFDKLKGDYTWKNMFLNRYYALFTIVNVVLLLSHLTSYLFVASQAMFVFVYLSWRNSPDGIVSNLLKVFTIYVMQILLIKLIWGNSPFTVYSLSRFNILQLLYILVVVLISLIITNYLSRKYGSKLLSANYWLKSAVSLSLLFLVFMSLYLLKEFIQIDLINVFITKPVAMLINSVITKNIEALTDVYLLTLLVITFLATLFIPLLIKTCNVMSVNRKIFIIYLLFTLLLPPFLLALIIEFNAGGPLSGSTSYHRYLILCTPPFMILLVITIEQGIKLFDRCLRYFYGLSIRRHYLRYAMLYSFIGLALLILPNSYQAAMKYVHNWSGTASQIVNLVRENPDQRYLIYEVSPRPNHLLDYYLSRYSDSLRVYNTIQRYEEFEIANNVNYVPSFEKDEDFINQPQNHFLIIAFMHERSSSYPETLNRLMEKYELYFKLLDRSSRGFYVFKIHDDLDYEH